MTSDMLKGFIDNSLAEMSYEELYKVIFAVSGGNCEEIGKAILAVKKGKGKSVQKEGDLGSGEPRAGPSNGAVGGSSPRFNEEETT